MLSVPAIRNLFNPALTRRPTARQSCDSARIPSQRILPEAWRLKTPVSPHLSAESDAVTLDPHALEPPTTNSPLIIEGAGGLLVPLTGHETFADVFALADSDYPLRTDRSRNHQPHALVTG